MLLGEWADAARAPSSTGALAINVADIDQGVYTRRPDADGLVANADAFIVLGLEVAHGLDDLPDRDALHRIARRLDVWRIVSTPRKVGERAVADHTPSPGIKMVSLMARIAALSHEQFVRHWSENHTPLALQHHVGLCNYTQHVVRRAYTPGGRTIDGIAELYFRTREDFETKFFDSDAGRDVIMADVDRFMDLRRSVSSLMTEYLMKIEEPQ